MADAQDLKSCEGLPSCGFESRLGYLNKRIVWHGFALGRILRLPQRYHLKTSGFVQSRCAPVCAPAVLLAARPNFGLGRNGSSVTWR